MTIVRDDGVLGGEPRIEGTRVGARHVAAGVIDRGQSPAAVAFDEGVVLVGTEARKEVLARAVAGDLPTTAESRERVAAAAARLTE